MARAADRDGRRRIDSECAAIVHVCQFAAYRNSIAARLWKRRTVMAGRINEPAAPTIADGESGRPGNLANWYRRETESVLTARVMAANESAYCV